ncbi:MAG: 1-deoxy-D-xylulose-5-phosphate synthase, partial [Muriicola sp.]|nr:1-deoxy-D-xylulose-5-phosphate synthase [Muriicola sp.]NNK35486.1 1-deoxy-D-xylulose-5-phosphate synthase [Eudoraea sp.]
KYQDVFGHSLVELAKQNKKIVGITPAMPTGSSLKYMMEAFPDRAFDVGIAEQHAVTMAAGMAAEGLVPFCAIYSTFLQRAYDQVIHDVALQKLPAIFCIDRAGLVGQDGATHHGAYDLAYLRCIPNMTIFAPMNEMELRNIMFTAQLGIDQPLAIRYPRGRGNTESWQSPFEKIPMGSSRELAKGTSIAVLSVGHLGNKVTEVLKRLGNPKEIGHYDMRFVKPLDKEQLHSVFSRYNSVVTLEDGCLAGGFGSAVLEFANEHCYSQKVERLGLPDTFIEQGTVDELQELSHIDEEAITRCLIKLLHEVR